MSKRKGPASFYADRGRIFQFFWPVTHYVVTQTAVFLGLILFWVLNRTRVRGRQNVPNKPNTLLLSNHQSMIDSFLVGICAYFPQAYWRPSLIPWNPAAEENFFNTPILAWLSNNFKSFPIKRGRKDMGAIFRMAEALRFSPLLLFPEGTRTRSGRIGRGRAGTGYLMLETWPTVVPVCISGMNKVLPIGTHFPKLFKKITVEFGEPIDLSEFKDKPKNKETAQAAIDKVIDRLQTMQQQLEPNTKYPKKHHSEPS